MASEFNLYKPFRRRGYWWLPDDSSSPVPGTIRFDPQGACELELDGSLGPTEHGEQSRGNTDLVYGKTRDGKDCTLVGAFEVARRSSGVGVESSRLVFNRLLIGDGPCDPETTCFTHCTVDIAGLGEWMERDPLSGIISPKPDSDGTYGSITYARPESVDIPIQSRDAIICIEPRLSGHYSYRVRQIEYREELVIRPREPRPYQWYLDIVFDFRDLLDLFLNRTAPIGSIALYSDSDAEDSGRRSTWPAKHDVCFRPVGPLYDRKQNTELVPFPYPVLANDLQRIVDEWFRAGERTSTLARLRFGALASERLTPEFSFLALMQGLESFHRATQAGMYLPRREYDAIAEAMEQAIPQQTPPDLRASLRSRLKYGNEHALRKRMNDLVDSLPGALRGMIFGDEVMSVARMVDARNYIVHRDESLRATSMTPGELIRAANRLDLLASYHLLRQAGLSAELLEKQMTQHSAFQRKL